MLIDTLTLVKSLTSSAYFERLERLVGVSLSPQT
jgi:hypothetical protein